MEFQRKCERACPDQDVITPIVSGEEVCLCSESAGLWLRVSVGD